MSNIIQGAFGKDEDAFTQQTIINGIMAKQAQGETINVFDLARSLNIDDDLSRVRDYLVKSSVCTKKEWQQAVQNARIAKELGRVPATALELVEIWVKEKRLRVDYQRRMHCDLPPTFEGDTITPENREDPLIDSVARIQESRPVNTLTLQRDLRMVCSKLGMRFSTLEIEDAVSAWFENQVQERVLEVFASIKFNKISRRRTEAAWAAAVSQFDPQEHDAAFVEAVLRKFIWQVKRKMLNLPVTNHLMPVLLGPQGVGKSTFVKEVLVKPVQELTSDTDFKMITDERNIDLWRNFVLFMDEMGFAGKADIDSVKNRITAYSITVRPMRTNTNIQVTQQATFIGCSNKELDQLIRDETGNRRFAALRFSNKPDWSRLNDIDASLLWTSVDERGNDPAEAIRAQLQERQEAVRERSQVEQWLEEHEVLARDEGKAQRASELYKAYSAWADINFPNRIMDRSVWGKEFTRLINNDQITEWQKVTRDGRSCYVFGRVS